jgi:hypothetical protein
MSHDDVMNDALCSADLVMKGKEQGGRCPLSKGLANSKKKKEQGEGRSGVHVPV